MEEVIEELKPVIIICPNCNEIRKKIDKKFNIIRRGYERNNLPRYFCLKCKKWFNESTSKNMQWYSR